MEGPRVVLGGGEIPPVLKSFSLFLLSNVSNKGVKEQRPAPRWDNLHV